MAEAIKLNKRIIVVIPARNEEHSIMKTLDHLANQSYPPTKVIIVDDGSQDNTVKLLQEYKSPNYELIIKERPDRIGGKSVVGTPLLATTFNIGFSIASRYAFDYVLIVGADILLEKDYIEKMLKKFTENPSLAIASGQNIVMRSNPSHARGAGRMIDYRFWRYYGGKYPVIYGWEDDCLIQCRRMGLMVKHFPSIRYRSVRKAQGTIDFLNWGRASRAMQYHPLISGLRAISLSIFQKYGIKAGVRYFAGYLLSPLPEKLSETQILNRNFFRRYQLNQLLQKIIYKLSY